MARRRYYKRRQREQEEGLATMIADLAMASTPFGVGATIVLAIAGFAFSAQPRALGGVASVVGMCLYLVAVLVGMMTLFGWLKRLLTAGPRGAERMPQEQWRGTTEELGRPVARPTLPAAPPTVQTTAQWHKGGAHPDRKAESRGEQTSGFKAPAPQSVVTREARPLLSKGEHAFYDPLRDIVAGRYEVLIKPSLVDVVGGRNDPEFAKIAKMHIDFVLCDRATMRPRLAIELDDASHRSRQRAWSDAKKTELLKQAGLPLLRVRCAQAYDVADLRQRIGAAAG